MAETDVRLLGGFRITVDGVPLGIPSAPARDLLSYVFLNRTRPERAYLAYRLWPRSSEQQARTNLRRVLHQLRGGLATIETVIDLAGPRIGVLPDAVVRLDVTAFDQALAAADAAVQHGEHDALHHALKHGVHVYGGDLLPGSYADWVEAERERLRNAYRRMLEQLVDLLERRGEPDLAIEYAERIVRCEPLDEQAYRRLMRLHLRAGRRAKALAVFQTCVHVLQRELSIGPSLDTLALKEQATSGETSWTWSKAGARPSDASPFVGRQLELGRLDAIWRRCCDRGSLFVHVHGEPGIGTSRLLQAFADRFTIRGVTVAVCHAFAGDQSVAFAPLVALLRNPRVRLTIDRLDTAWRAELATLMPELTDDRIELTSQEVGLSAGDVGRLRHRLFDAVAQAFTRAGPLALVIDDAHLADADTLACLHHVLRSAAKTGVLVVAGTPTTYAGDATAFTALMVSLRHDAMMVELPLGPLPPNEALQVVHHLCGDAGPAAAQRALVGDANGNPLFLIEAALRMVGSPGSHGGQGAGEFRSVIADRLRRLPSDVKVLAATAATIGRSFTFEHLARVRDDDEQAVVTALEELCRARVIDEVAAGEYTFIHDALHEAAERMMSQTRRKLVERRAARAMRRSKATVGAQRSVAATAEQKPVPVTTPRSGR